MSSNCFSNVTSAPSHSILIPVDKNLEKELENIKAEKEINQKITKPNYFVEKLAYCPYLNHFIKFKYLTVVADVVFIICFFSFIGISNIIWKNDKFLEKYVEPCNATNITTFVEVKIMKDKLEELENAKNSTKFVTGYNISTYANKYLEAKLDNLTSEYESIAPEFQQQKELYFNCYKQNVIKQCKDDKKLMVIILPIYYLLQIAFHFGTLTLEKAIRHRINMSLHDFINKYNTFLVLLKETTNSLNIEKNISNAKIEKWIEKTELLKNIYNDAMELCRTQIKIKVLSIFNNLAFVDILCMLLTMLHVFLPECHITDGQIKEFPF